MIRLAINVKAVFARWVASSLFLVAIGTATASRAIAGDADAPRSAATPRANAAPHASATAHATDAHDAKAIAPSAATPEIANSAAIAREIGRAPEAPSAPEGPRAPEAPSAPEEDRDNAPASPPPVGSAPSPASPPAPNPIEIARPAASAVQAPAGAASAAAAAANDEAPVRLHDRQVFVIRTAMGGQSAEARARSATQTLERLVEERDVPEVRVEEQAERVVVFGGATPIVQLGTPDATAAGDANVSIHAASIAAKIRDALQTERQRKAIAETVFSFSLFAFSGLIAIVLLGKVRELASKLHAWMERHPDKLPALRIQGIDLVRPAALRGGLSVALSAGRLFSQLGIAYGWLLFASSLFESTRTYTERLTGFVLTPLSALIGRVGSALPLLVILAAAVVITVLVVRFVGLFFGSVGRGETTLGSLPRDLAVPTGALVRFGIVVVALLVAAPLITGNDDGALARAGVATLVALGFASAPVLASVMAGIPAIYGRRVRVGERVEIGGKAGRVLAVGLLEVRLEDDLGCQIRIPHLASLFSPTRVIGVSPVVTIEMAIDSQVSQVHARQVLLAEARRFGTNARVDLLAIDAGGAHYRVTVHTERPVQEHDLATTIADSLLRENIALGRMPPRLP